MVVRLKANRCFIVLCGLIIGALFLYSFNTGDEVVPGWPLGSNRNIVQYLTHNGKLDIDIIPDSFCSNHSFLLILVTSSPLNAEYRSAVRETYGSQKLVVGNNVSLYFVLGRTKNSEVQERIRKENKVYGDIIQGSFIDSYNNLTLKTVFLMGIVSQHCQDSAAYLLKTDDDTYINLNLLVNDLKTNYSRSNEIIGKVYIKPQKITSRGNKWFLPDYIYPNKILPTFASGTGYVISMDIVDKLYKTALITPYVHLEDVFLTGLCALENNITPVNNIGFLYQHMLLSFCHMRKYVTIHSENRFKPSDLKYIHKWLNDRETIENCENHSFSVLGWLFHLRFSLLSYT